MAKNSKGKTLADYPKLIKVGDRKIRVFSAEQEAKELGQSVSVTSPKEEVKTNSPTPEPSPPVWGKPN